MNDARERLEALIPFLEAHHVDPTDLRTVLDALSPPDDAMIEAGAGKIGGGSTFDHEERREMAEEIYTAMQAALLERGRNTK